MQPKVFAIIINWNGHKDAAICLESLLSLHYENFHVIISDNGSKPGSLDSIREWICRHDSLTQKEQGIQSYSILENGKNLGFTGANTTGIRYAMEHGADYVLFLNNDTIVTPKFLLPMVEAAESRAEIGIVGCKIFYANKDPDGRHKIWSLGGYRYNKGMPINIAGGEYDREEWKGIRPQALINGCCMLIKKQVIESIGVQDDSLFFGIDDVEYSFRASKHGWQNLVVYDSVIYHSASQSMVQRSGLQGYYIFRNALMFRTRNYPWYENIVFISTVLFRYVFAASIYRWLVGRGKVNRGVYFAIKDFLQEKTGECTHAGL